MGDEKKALSRAQGGALQGQRSNPSDVAAFLDQVRSLTQRRAEAARLVLALDATMSRQPTWDLACTLQGQMFDAVGRTGALSVQLVYFRGLGECRASRFVEDTGSLKDLMARIDCRGGHTQIGRVLANTLKESERARVKALVYIGDAMEEPVDDLSEKAGRLGLLGTPIFVFQEGREPVAEKAFKDMARLSRGAWFRFDRDSASRLASLLSSVAVYATGGVPALESRGRPEDFLMIENLRGRR
ncbi:MAG: VWA domain-containing protein [Rhizobiaceae bacterium]|nr:VWA domain-containing protein [Rhizobiaceae bacterium]